MRCYNSDHYVLPLPEGHRFPMQRYALLRQYVEQMPGIELHEAPAASLEDLQRAHLPEYVDKVLNGQLDRMEQRRLGFPWSPQLVQRSLRSVGATVAAARHCWSQATPTCAANLAGGTHHAFADRGEGFCLFNDGVVAARTLGIRVAFVDLDVHQGNGTAALARHDPRLFTLSLHGRHNYPFHKEQSDCDLELPDGCQDDEYLEILQEGLQRVWHWQPQLVIYLAGADPYRGDRLGRLGLSEEGLARRDREVLQGCRQRNLPVVITMAGGYAVPIEDTARIQARTVALAQEIYTPYLAPKDVGHLLPEAHPGFPPEQHVEFPG